MIVKGFIDAYRGLYAIPNGTMVVCRLIELLLFPSFVDFAERNVLRLVLAREQND